MTFSSFEHLSSYGSVLRSEIVEHLEQLILTLNQTDLYRGNQKLLVEDTAIIPSVIWHDTVFAEEVKPAKNGRLPSLPFLNVVSTRTDRETSGREALPLEQFQGDDLRLVIKGDAGSGKTFITKKRSIDVARRSVDDLQSFRGALEDIVLPIWTTANEISSFVSDNCIETLMALVYGSYPRFRGFSRLDKWYRAQFSDEGNQKRAKHILFVDGLDELLDSNQYAFAKVLRQLSSFRGPVILACRSWRWESLRSLVDWPHASVGELTSFTVEEQESFVKKFFPNDVDEKSDRMLQIIDANHSLGSALRSPMLLTYACLLHEINQLDADLARNDLWDRIIGRLFDCTFPPKAKPSWMLPGNHNEGRSVRIGTSRFLFEEVSLQLFRCETGSRDISSEDWSRAFESALAETRLVLFKSADELPSSEAFIRNLLGIRLLVQSTGKDGTTSFRYLHRTFLEYASAKALARRENWLNGATALFWDFDAWGVLGFLAGEIKDIRPLIKSIRDEEQDIFGTMFLLEAMTVAAASPADKFNFEVCDEFIALTLRLFTRDSLNSVGGFLNFRHGKIYCGYIKAGTRSLLARDSTRRKMTDILYLQLIRAVESASADLENTLGSKLRIFCDLGLTEAKLSLRFLLQDAGKASKVRVFAAYALAALRDPDAERILVDIVRNSPKNDRMLRCNCAIALKSFDSMDTTFFLEILTDSAEDHVLRSYVAALLNPSLQDKAIDNLLTQYRSQQGKVQEESFELLSLLDTKKERPELTNLVKLIVDRDRVPLRQKLAILYLGRNGITGCTDSLLRLVGDKTEHIDVRIAAAEALGELRFRPACDRLLAIAEDASEKRSEIRSKAIDVLVSMGMARSIRDWRKIVKLDGNDDESLIRSIISVWRTTKSESSIPLLVKIVRDYVRPSVEVRVAAATALASIAVGHPSSIVDVTNVLLSCRRTDSSFENQLDDVVASPLFYLWQSTPNRYPVRE